MRKILGYYIDPRGDGRIETLCDGLPAHSSKLEYQYWCIEEKETHKEVLLLIEEESGEFLVDETCVLWDNYFDLIECVRNNDCCVCEYIT